MISILLLHFLSCSSYTTYFQAQQSISSSWPLHLLCLLSYLHSSDTTHVLECIPISGRAFLAWPPIVKTVCHSHLGAFHVIYHGINLYLLINSKFPPWECKLLDHRCFGFLFYLTQLNSLLSIKSYMQPHKKDNKKGLLEMQEQSCKCRLFKI